MTDMRGNFINGKFLFPETHVSHLPRSFPWNIEQKLEPIPFSIDTVNEAVHAAEKAFDSWALLPMEKRIHFLKKYAEVLTKKEELITRTIASETGKPYWESQQEAKTLVNKVNISLHEGLNLVKEETFPKVLPDADGKISYKPLGVCVVLGPFNFPCHLANGHIVPALLMGNTVVFKPSEKTPLSGQLLAECLDEAGLPPGVFNLVQGDKEVGHRLAVHQDVHGIFFTGSFEVGEAIREATRNHYWKILALEMGGKNPMVICEDANLKGFEDHITKSVLWTSGQRCASTSRIICHSNHLKEIQEIVVETFKKANVGHPFDSIDNSKPKPLMGPLIDGGSVERMIRFQGIAKREGAKCLLGAERLNLSPKGHFVSPSVHLHESIPSNSVYHNTEIFAPDVCIIPFDFDDMAVKICHEPGFGLASSVFTESKERFEYFRNHLRFGHINLNLPTTGASSKMPFGGFGKSGNHRPAGTHSFYYCCHPSVTLFKA